MENTEKVLFADDKPQWYIAMGDRWVGPVSASDVYERVKSQKISWAHFVWKPGEKEWKRLCDVKMFKAAVPQEPSKEIQKEVKEVSKEVRRDTKPVVRAAGGRTGAKSKNTEASSEEKGWFLYYNETQFGPFNQDEVVRFLNVGRVNPRVHAWRSGIANWTRLEELDSFKAAIQELKTSKGGSQEKDKSEHRQTPRRPMVAKILVANEHEVSDAVCRDISVGGMQVLTDRVPGKVGEKVRLNVTASSIEPFVAEGVIVRFLEDQKGFSFRFDRLSDQAKRSIEKYIQSPQ
jgi:hypothetical protein